MKLLLVGIAPSKDCESALLSQGFSLTTSKRLPSNADADLIAFHPKNASELAPLKQVRETSPNAWIAIIASVKQLKAPAFQNALLNCPEKDDVWCEETWELLFWIALQRAIHSQDAGHEAKKVKRQWLALKADYKELSESSRKLIRQIEKDVGLVTSLQRSLLPRVSPEIPGLSLAVKYLPAAGLGGDYYDIFEFGDRKRFGVLLADSKTHGMAAALLSILLKVKLEEMKDRFPGAGLFVDYLNREIQLIPRSDRAPLSLLYGILDRSSLEFHFASAGALRPLLWRNGKFQSIECPESPPLGTADHFAFEEHSIRLQPGDLLILHTDGLEGPLTQKHPHARDKLAEILDKHQSRPDPREIQNELMALIDRHVEKQPLADDLTIIHFAVNERALYVAQSK